jgi:hypothetical protein
MILESEGVVDKEDIKLDRNTHLISLGYRMCTQIVLCKCTAFQAPTFPPHTTYLHSTTKSSSDAYN